MAFDKKNVKVILFVVFTSILFFWFLQKINVVWGFLSYIISILVPFITGGAIAFVINVPMRKIEQLLPNILGKLKRIIAYILTILLLAAVLLFALFVIVPDISKTISSLALQVPSVVDKLKKFAENFMVNNPEVSKMISGLNLDFDKLTTQAISLFQGGASGILNIGVSIISGTISGVVSFIIAFMFSIYILMQKEKLSLQAKQVVYSFCPTSIADKLIRIARMSNKAFSNFISGQCLEALILGIMFFIVLSIFRFPYALLISVVVTISALIPIVGAFIGCALGFFLILMINPMQALIFIGVFLILQQLEGNLIYPHVVGNSVGLPSIWVLVAVTLGAGLFGIIGIIIFIPICSVLYALFKESVKERLKIRNISQEKFK